MNKKHRVSLEIESGNPFQLLSHLKNLGFRIYKVNKAVDDYLAITNLDELAILSAELDAHNDEYLLKASYNNVANRPSMYAFAMIDLYKGHWRLHLDYEED